LASFYAVFRYRKKFPDLIFPANFSLTLFLAYWLTRQMDFSYLISYERAGYANRILIESFLFLLPIIAILFYRLLNRVLAEKLLIKHLWLVLLVILIAVSLYGSYPRKDNYYNSRSFSVGASDLAAVNWIDQDAKGQPYVVLSDQQVAVGALWTFGFSHYFKNDIFFYPIPTGGPLYQVYLDMVYKKADRATALEASDLTSAPLVYFVINKYWTGFDKIAEQAKIGSDSFQDIDNGQIQIFKYLKP
jgi:hypothetical protein